MFAARPTMLLVDDEPRNLLALAALLQPFDARLVTAFGGRSAIDSFDTEDPDLVICDLAMPECDGVEVLRAIRAHRRRSETPFVIVTAHGDREHRLRALQAGADDYIEKPIDGPVLTARIRTLLRIKHSRDALERAHDELAFRNDMLKRLQCQQRELMSFVVHDMRVPITALNCAIDWCQRHASAAQAELAHALAEAAAASQRLGRMSQDIVTISQLEDEAFPVKLSRVRADALVEEVLAGLRPMLEHRRVDFVCRDSDSTDVVADASLLRRVVENLLDNAIRHTAAAGHVRVEVGVAEHASIVISNDGPRLAAEDDVRIFEKYAGADRRADGTTHAGLGLYFCKRAMLALHGDIAIVDVPDWPASFRVTLPASER